MARAGFELALLAKRNGLLNPIEQQLLVERLLHEIHGTFAHRLDGQGNVAMPGNENDRKIGKAFAQNLLQYGAADSRHADVEDQALAAVQFGRIQEAVAIGEGRASHAQCFEQHAKRFPNHDVVVYDADKGVG
jgi:hypothetical protein